MSNPEFADLLEALLYVFGPWLGLFRVLVLTVGIWSALVALGLEIVAHRKRKSPAI